MGCPPHAMPVLTRYREILGQAEREKIGFSPASLGLGKTRKTLVGRSTPYYLNLLKHFCEVSIIEVFLCSFPDLDEFAF